MPTFTRNTFESRPVSPAEGDSHFSTNGARLDVYDNNAWKGFGPIFATQEPPTTGWTWINQLDSFVSGAGLSRIIGRGSQSNKATAYVRPISNHTNMDVYYNIAVEMVRWDIGDTYPSAGICLADSVSGNMVAIAFGNTSPNTTHSYLNIFTFNNSTNVLTPIKIVDVDETFEWVRIVTTPTTRTFYVGKDKGNLLPFYSESVTSFITPNRHGLFIYPNNGAIAQFAGIALKGLEEISI